MTRRGLYLLSAIALVSGFAFIGLSGDGPTGASVWTLYSNVSMVGVGLFFLVAAVSLIVVNDNLEGLTGEKMISRPAKWHHWVVYDITPGSEAIDQRVDERTGKSSGFGYLNAPRDFPSCTRTPMQERIERSVSGGGLIVPYVGVDVDEPRRKARGEAVNRRNSYAEQFNEPHAAGGGRIIDVGTHICKAKVLESNIWLSRGRLMHFNRLANGKYIWVVDKNGGLVVGDRLGIEHDMCQMPRDTGSGERHEKIDKRKTTLPHSTLARGRGVYGAGELTIENGLIKSYNADSGHYAKLLGDLGGPAEPENFVMQSIDVFKYFSKKVGWREVKAGAAFDSSY